MLAALVALGSIHNSVGLAQSEVKLSDGLIGHWRLETDARDESARQRQLVNRGV